MGAEEDALLAWVATGGVPRRDQVLEWLLRRAWLSEARDADGARRLALRFAQGRTGAQSF